jgi:hypothetical protein
LAPVLTHPVTRDANVHDGTFHAATDDPDWAESSCFTVSVPERDINGFIYYFHDVRCGISGGGPGCGSTLLGYCGQIRRISQSENIQLAVIARQSLDESMRHLGPHRPSASSAFTIGLVSQLGKRVFDTCGVSAADQLAEASDGYSRQ